MAENNKKMVANAEFEKEKNVGLNIDQLSYICDYCGKVNQIGAPRCVRCGKRRPRNEYINAMSKIKASKTIKAEYLEEQGRIETEKKDVAQQQIVRLVESRVEDEKQNIIAQENLRLDQEREAIKKSTARDAVLRIIAAEKAAEDKVKDAEARADDAIKGRNVELESVIEEEKRKVLEVASQKVVAARAGIEEAAREQIEANKKIADRFVNETLAEEKDKAQRNAARRAVLQIIAAEKVADEKVKTTKDALQQAAVERIIEERMLADKEASSRYLAEKQAIERAADERIKAEKDTLKKLLEDRQGGMGGQYMNNNSPYGMQQSYVQPLTIVPYLNPNQPVYQYKPNQVYKFVPNTQAGVGNNANQAVATLSYDNNTSPVQEQKASKRDKIEKPKEERTGGKSRVRIMSILSIIVIAVVLVFGTVLGKMLPIISNFNNIDILVSLLAKFNVSLNIGTVQSIGMAVMIGYAVFILFALIALIQNIIRLISGKAAKLGFIIPLIALAGIAVTLLIWYMSAGFSAISTGAIIFAVLALVLLIFTIIGGVKTKKAKISL